MHRVARRATLLFCVLGLPWLLYGLAPSTPTEFAAQIASLSEPEGAFDTDNLISNERSYLQVLPALPAAMHGVYIGVGPDQNFSYIARVRPVVAYIVDIRRDNLLLHLLFKALFTHARHRVEYLSLLTGRAPPADPARFRDAPADRIVRHIDAGQPHPPSVRRLRRQIDRTIAGFGVPLSEADRTTIDRFHRAFIDQGLDLRFQSHGRPPRQHYPTLRELVLATGRDGRQWSYLATEDDFQFVRELQARDRVIPVVGNVSGPHALASIAGAMRGRSERLSAFYVSNVEDYLFRDGRFERYIQNVARLPRAPDSVMIRAIFSGGGSVSVVQPVRDLVAHAQLGRYRNYWDLAGHR
jgi:hypothetical protein